MRLPSIIKYILVVFVSIAFLKKANGQDNLDSLKNLLNTLPDDTVKIETLQRLCNTYGKFDYDRFLKYARRQYELSVKLKNSKWEINSLLNLGLALSRKNMLDSAMSNYLLALKISEKIDNKNLIANANDKIGTLYYTQNNYDKALEYYNKANLLYSELGDDNGMSGVQINIGGILYEKSDLKNAAKNFEQALTIKKKIGDESGAAEAQNNLGVIYHRLEQYDKALFYYEESKKYYDKTSDKEGIINCMLNIGYVFDLQGKHHQALEKLNKCLEMSKEIGSIEFMSYVYLGMGEAYKNMYKADSSFKYMSLYADYKDSLFNQESNRNVAEMATKYDTEKKEAENNLLKAKTELDSVELEKKSEQQKMLLIGLVLALTLVVYVAYSLNQKKKVNKLLNNQNQEISIKNKIIEEKNKDITDSINYAQRIQNAILPEITILQNYYKSFVYYQPKDIVSGDFYWIKEVGKKIYFSVVDCTGHGVPGAFMSIIGYNSLNRIVEDLNIVSTGKILDELNKQVNKALASKKTEELTIRDGMDISICCINRETNMLEYSGANNSLYLLRKSTEFAINFDIVMQEDDIIFYEIKPNKMPIGGGDNQKSYQSHSFQLQQDDSIYLFSDGYADQFGGPKGKKFMYKNFKRLIFSLQNEAIENQSSILDKTMVDWRGELNQLDDICVMGVKVS